jgi:uncharacterized protein (DUF1778 family)
MRETPMPDEQHTTNEEEPLFLEEVITPLSDRDRDLFLSLLNDPPPPNEALRKAVARSLEKNS